MSPYDNSVRVTMDREVYFEPDPTTRMEAALKDPILVFGKRVILELKFTGRFPDWWNELVRVFGLQQASAAKYADGIACYGEARVRRAVSDAAFLQQTQIADPESTLLSPPPHNRTLSHA